MSDKDKSRVFMYANGPKKYLGQNFLKSDKYAQIAVKALEITAEDNVLEIGPGNGALTRHLFGFGFLYKSLSLVEYDKDLMPNLNRLAEKEQKVTVTNQNILDCDLSLYTKIIGAIPYNITSPIIHTIIARPPYAKTVVLIIQKEVAKKICHKDLNYFNLLTFFYDKKIIENIKNVEFYPIPKVDSSIIKFEINDYKLEIFNKRIENINIWSKFLHQLFRSPRKKIKSSFTTEILERALINQDLRPHQLSIDDVINLFSIQKSTSNIKI